MKQLYLRLAYVIFSILIFFFVAPFATAFFANYVVNISSIGGLYLDSLQSTTTPFSISLDPKYIPYFNYAIGGAKYRISRSNYYDNDLCPYISLSPKNEESTEIGFEQNASDFYNTDATGEINGASDTSDNWNITITSPCFEGQCPADYNPEINGDPLPQSLKGQTFTCNISVYSVDPPVLVKKLFDQNVAYAVVQNKITVSATLTGQYTPPVTGYSNVLFLPGLEASRLYTTKTILGVPIEDQLWEPNWNSDGVDLYLNSSGQSINPNIYTRDIILESNVPFWMGFLGQNIYKSFAKTMDSLVETTSSKKMAEWRAFAYDWRQSPDDIASEISLLDTLQSLVNSSNTGKVTIVAHSNGGIVAKLLLKKLEDDKIAGRNSLIDHIDTVMLVAVPQFGTPTAIPALLHGYDQDLGLGLLLNTPTARELGRNMPGGYTLLPSREYYNHVSTPVTYFVPNTLDPYMTNDIKWYGQSISDYDSENSFLAGSDGRTNPGTLDTLKPIKLGTNFLTQADATHNRIDKMTLPSNIRLIQIAGWGLDTIAGFQYNASTTCSYATDNGCTGKFILDEKPIFTSDGDKTVVTPSALGMEGERWWVNMFKYNNDKFPLDPKNEHKNILEVQPLLDFVSSIIQSTKISSTYLSTTSPIDIKNRLRLSVHSPVTLDAYDASGNHTGKVCPPTTDICYTEENIPNSGYYEFGEGKYLNIPQDGVQKIIIQGTDVGTFTFDAETVSPNGQSSTSSFIDIPVTTQTQAEITESQNGVPQMTLDVTGDGKTDFTLTPNSTFDPITYLQIMQTTIDSLDLTQTKKNAFDKRVDNIIKSIQKGKVDKAKLKADRFKTVLENKLSKPDPKKPKPKRLSKTDAQLLLDLLNGLLDNLS